MVRQSQSCVRHLTVPDDRVRHPHQLVRPGQVQVRGDLRGPGGAVVQGLVPGGSCDQSCCVRSS